MRGTSSLSRPRSGSRSMSSVNTNMLDDHGIYSSYTNPDHRSVAGLSSYFGIDSPSYSRRGSFTNAKRKTPFSHTPHGPSPLCYKADRDKVLPVSPRATIGNSK